ncbi:Carbohydrate-binding family 9 [Pedobacter sp. ok626]|nr:Carbohydrate-binding family 9 [Pedobacter sp. ok626]
MIQPVLFTIYDYFYLMKNLFVPFLDQYAVNDSMETVSTLLDALPKNQIAHQPWPEFYTPIQANFTIAHSNDAIWLKYEVHEDTIKVATSELNGVVHKDNCVEFFVSFGTDKSYYNIEVNCVGICLIAYGKERSNRDFLPKELVKMIKTHAVIKTAAENSKRKYVWEITLMIPIVVFGYSNLKTLSQQTGFGNFFKCGDDLPQPHFCSWNEIEAEAPNFHLPEFFGSLAFGEAADLKI